MNEFTYLYCDFIPDFNSLSINKLERENNLHHGVYHTKDVMNVILADNREYYTFVFTDWRELEDFHKSHGTFFVYMEELIFEFKIQLRNIKIDNIFI